MTRPYMRYLCTNVYGLTDRMLMPAFGTAAIREMFDDMVDIASQLVLKWDR